MASRGTSYFFPLFLLVTLVLILLITMLPPSHSAAAGLILGVFQLVRPAAGAVDADWYPPASRNVNNLTEALNAEGVYGFIFDSSKAPDKLYGTYNWCNMPHVRKREYVRAEKGYELRYVELVSLL
jgi:hypothetical protein